MSLPRTLVITGASGRLGTYLRASLGEVATTARLLDIIRPPEPAAEESVEVFQGSVTDPEVLEAAHPHGLKRVVVASSNHAVGFRVRGPQPLADDVAPMPDSLYGASKAAAEALCEFYSCKFSMEIACVRIGSCFDSPENARMLSTWLSPADFVRLTRACLTGPCPGFRLVWGVSANTRRWWSTAGGDAIGFHPQDNAERFANLYPTSPPDPEYVGGIKPLKELA